MGIYQRKFGLPIHCTNKTLAVSQRHHRLGHLNNLQHFVAGQTLTFGPLRVETIPTPHDAADGVAFIVEMMVGGG